MCIPWVNRDSRDSIDAAERELLARGWVENPTLARFERGGWYLWFRSQGELASPIAQFNRIAPWGDEIDGWGSAHIGFIDDTLTCPSCGDYSGGGLCSDCLSEDGSTRSQLTLF
jgi:hypothetical protein